MSKIKRYFTKKKEEVAFRLRLRSGMGQGRQLNAAQPYATPSILRRIRAAHVPPLRHQQHDETSAAAANLVLLSMMRKYSWPEAAPRPEREAFKELPCTGGSASMSSTGQQPELACEGVFFRCPELSPEVLPKQVWQLKIKDMLHRQLEHERGLAGCLIIRNCNPVEKADDCRDALVQYLENIIQSPDQEQFSKIRMSNTIFNGRVRYVDGALDVLHAAGFDEVAINGEPFLVWSKAHIELDLNILVETLKHTQSFKLILDRNTKVLQPAQAIPIQLPDDFFRISAKDTIESSQMPIIGAMRESIYSYTLIRIKLPDGLYLQGTFDVKEKVSDIFDFVRSCLTDETLPFDLSGKLNGGDMDKTLYDCKLIPNAVLLLTVPGLDDSLAIGGSLLKAQLQQQKQPF
ncbi:UBX domain-containing protein 6-like [Drosophila novamexicana]|uniref:UBX domain-containing protein 6-like n=1 Tax=Drosophila novamexicana TaxID=47314 RepID=UPI0011E6050A|nr:UBX domain-containing protein 6-like [Drosophila novamexicana]